MKLKKLVALFTAGALCLGMSLTAFAADGSREKLPIAGNGVTEDGVVISSDPEKIKDVIKEDLQLPSDAKVAVLGVMNYEPEGTVKDGSTVTFALSPSTAGDLKEGETIAVLHLKKIVDKDGNVSYVWETKVGTVRKLGNGVYVDVELDDFSPVAFVKVMSNGDVVKWNAKGEVVSTTSTTTKKVSPKTGE